MKHCTTCNEPLSEARLRAKPDATQCTSCLAKAGDVAPVRGHMIWSHKTAPHIEIDTQLAREQPEQHPRTPRTTQSLPSSKRYDVEGVVVNRRLADCHPNRPALSSRGLCVECSIEWYRKRLWRC